MVATRSQDQEHAMPMKASKEARNTNNPNSGKRKRVNELTTTTTTTTTTDSPAKKARLKKDTASTLAAVVIPTAKHDEASLLDNRFQADSLSHGGTVKSSHLPLRGRKEQSHLSKGGHHETAGPDNGLPNDDPKSGSSVPTSHGQLPGVNQSAPSRERKSKSSDKSTPSVDAASMTKIPPNDTLPHSDGKTTNSRHKRFGSEETDSTPLMLQPNPLRTRELHTQRAVKDTESDSSEDEAPEILTQASAQQKAHLTSAEAIKAADSQRAIEKQKRRNRDRLLKSQAKPTKQAERVDFGDKDLEAFMDDDNTTRQSPPSVTRGQPKRPSKDTLPVLLPDEILAAEPMVRLPTPPPSQREVARATVNTKRRFLDQTSKPPKDIQKGNLRIRVLEDRRKVLPPKVSKSSQLIRESWLAGRLGHTGRVVMERRKMVSAFVRR
ncbi:MAG: hypothetical protein Q9186_006667 [Xanthomendoza sp. 1 TL-2023]